MPQLPLPKCDFDGVGGLAFTGAPVPCGAFPGRMPSPAADRDPFAITSGRDGGTTSLPALASKALGLSPGAPFHGGRTG